MRIGKSRITNEYIVETIAVIDINFIKNTLIDVSETIRRKFMEREICIENI